MLWWMSSRCILASVEDAETDALRRQVNSQSELSTFVSLLPSEQKITFGYCGLVGA